VRDRASVFRLLERERPDALVHLAFVVNPMHDEQAMYEIDVGGTQNVLDAASTAGTGQLLVTSSATAYGAFPDTPGRSPRTTPYAGCPTLSTRATRPNPIDCASCGRAAIPTAS
jgi:nucleoside-diphosphate-sugar epimerase